MGFAESDCGEDSARVVAAHFCLRLQQAVRRRQTMRADYTRSYARPEILGISARAEEIVRERKWVKPSRKDRRAQIIIGVTAGAFAVYFLYLCYIHFYGWFQ
jgi:hypothetical protein